MKSGIDLMARDFEGNVPLHLALRTAIGNFHDSELISSGKL